MHVIQLDMMLCAIKRRRYEVCFQLLSYIVGLEANIQIPAAAREAGNGYSSYINHGSSIERRDWAIQIAYILFRTHLDSEYGHSLADVRNSTDVCGAAGMIKSLWYLPLLAKGEASKPGVNLRNSSQANCEHSILSHFKGPLCGLCQDKKSGAPFDT